MNMPVQVINNIKDPIGYGVCAVYNRLCVFNFTHAVTCGLHPKNCGHMPQPRFIRKNYEETFNVQKDMETAQEADSDPDPNAHQ